MQQLKQLKRNKSLQIREGMPVKWPKQKNVGKFNVAKAVKNVEPELAYNTQNGITAFVDYGVLYVTPFQVDTILEENGFKKADFHVPFSSGDLPQGKDLKLWERLIRDEQMSHHKMR